MGRFGMATAPRITVTIAITIAKMGRSMKNLAITSPSSRRRRGAGVGTRRHSHAGSNLLQPVDDDWISRLESLLDDPALVHAIARDDGPRDNRVVRPHGQHRLLSLQVLDGLLRHQQRLRSF